MPLFTTGSKSQTRRRTLHGSGVLSSCPRVTMTPSSVGVMNPRQCIYREAKRWRSAIGWLEPSWCMASRFWSVPLINTGVRGCACQDRKHRLRTWPRSGPLFYAFRLGGGRHGESFRIARGRQGVVACTVALCMLRSCEDMELARSKLVLDTCFVPRQLPTDNEWMVELREPLDWCLL